MRDGPTKELLELLKRLNLAETDDVRAVAKRARKMVRGIPAFDSVWVDALLQAGMVTAYQARHINDGRGDELLVEDVVIVRPLASHGYAQLFQGRRIGDGRLITLLTASIPETRHSDVERKLQSLVERSSRLDNGGILPVQTAKLLDRRGAFQASAVCADVEAIAADRWMVPHGRFPPQTVLEIARQMAAALAELEKHEILHSDLSAKNLRLSDDGTVMLLMPGMRAIVHPEEGYGHADLPPSAFDYVAPERVVDGCPVTVASELFACGSLCWHLLAGRPPFPGGNSIAKLRNIQQCRVRDIRTIAPETDERLFEAITCCTHPDPKLRGGSFDQLAAQLGEPTPRGRTALAQCLQTHVHSRVPFRSQTAQSSLRWRTLGATAAAITISCGLFFWLLRDRTASLPVANLGGEVSLLNRHLHPAPHDDPTTAGERPGGKRLTDVNPPAGVVVITPQEAQRGQLPTLREGITIRGQGGHDVIFEVPPSGLTVDASHVRFENIHFRRRFTGDSLGERPLIKAHGRWIEFQGCSFQGVDWPFGTALPTAISCNNSPESALQIVIDDCVFRAVASAVSSGSADTLRIDIGNSLLLGPGTLLRMKCSAGRKPVVAVYMSRVTVRGSTSLLEYLLPTAEDRLGQCSIIAENCVLAPQVGSGLFCFQSGRSPQSTLQRIRWSGEGSLLSKDTEIAIWEKPDGDAAVLDATGFSMDGLTQFGVDFVGPQLDAPASSGLKEWTGPSRDERPPGADSQRLRLPTRSNRAAP